MEVELEEEDEKRENNLMQSQVKINEIDIRKWQRGIENEVGQIANLSNGFGALLKLFSQMAALAMGYQ
jgi:hypothetical protein